MVDSSVGRTLRAGGPDSGRRRASFPAVAVLPLLMGEDSATWDWPQWAALAVMVVLFLWACAAAARVARPREDSES